MFTDSVKREGWCLEIKEEEHYFKLVRRSERGTDSDAAK